MNTVMATLRSNQYVFVSHIDAARERNLSGCGEAPPNWKNALAVPDRPTRRGLARSECGGGVRRPGTSQFVLLRLGPSRRPRTRRLVVYPPRTSQLVRSRGRRRGRRNESNRGDASRLQFAGDRVDQISCEPPVRPVRDRDRIRVRQARHDAIGAVEDGPTVGGAIIPHRCDLDFEGLSRVPRRHQRRDSLLRLAKASRVGENVLDEFRRSLTHASNM